MTRVLVTGATGFIGTHAIAPLLEADLEVHAVTQRADWGPAGVITHRADLLDAHAALKLVGEVKADWLLHLAWYATPGLFWTSPENLRWVEATLRLLHAFESAGGTRAVVAGTCAEYDWSYPRSNERLTPLRPATFYGVSKYATYIVSHGWAEKVAMELAWGRVFFAYGPGEAAGRLVPSVVGHLLAGEPAPATDGLQVRDFLYVEDVARALVCLLASSVRGPVNIGSGVGVTVRSIVERLGQEVGREELLRIGAMKPSPGEPAELVADVARLRDEVGFVPRVPLVDGIRSTVQWWRESGSGLVTD
jgi:nucleoside-diphosphate-sugar epimerase